MLRKWAATTMMVADGKLSVILLQVGKSFKQILKFKLISALKTEGNLGDVHSLPPYPHRVFYC